MTAPHTCVYINGFCTLGGRHGGVPDPDPTTARPEAFAVIAGNDGDKYLECAHYGQGCWWSVEFGSEYSQITGYSLGELMDAARQHLADDHRAVVDSTATEPEGNSP